MDVGKLVRLPQDVPLTLQWGAARTEDLAIFLVVLVGKVVLPPDELGTAQV